LLFSINFYAVKAYSTKLLFYGYVLDGWGIEIPVSVRFSTPIQTSPVAHPVACTVGNKYLSQG